MALRTVEPDAWSVDPSWSSVLSSFWASHAGESLRAFLRGRLAAGATVFPDEPLMALRWTSLPQVRVVILGQDPYHGPGQAEGLAFSVPTGVTWPPSLRNVLLEWHANTGLPLPKSGSLRPWARQGVLLLNSCLTVEQARPAAHAGRGWETLTDALIQAVAMQPQPVAFLLWGAHAQAKQRWVEASASAGPRLVLQSNHPSPLSARRGSTPFIGCQHFIQTQTWLQAQGVDWDWALEKTQC